jgi:hypothetical protein
MCTDTSLSAVDSSVSMACASRSSAASSRLCVSFSYHFRMKDMIPLRYHNGNQYLHRKSPDYRNRVKRKMSAYHAFIQAGVKVFCVFDPRHLVDTRRCSLLQTEEALIVGYGLRPSRQRPGHDWRGQRWRSPGSRAKGFCACQGLRRRGVGMCLAISTPAVLPSVGRKTSAPRTCLTPLNTSPAPSPVNASRLPSRASRASLGASAVRYSFTVTDFHRLPFAGLPAHPSTTSKPAARAAKKVEGS